MTTPTKRQWRDEAAIAGLLLALVLAFFWKLALTNLILTGIDSLLYFYPYRDYAAEALRQGRIPLWNPYLFMGAPFLANIQAAVFYPLNWPLAWLSTPRQFSLSIVMHVFLAALGAYAFGRASLRLTGRAGALVAAMAFALGGFVGAQVEHINQLSGMAWLPWLFLLLDLASGRGEADGERIRPGAAVLLALVIALQILAGHSQTVYISLFGLGLYALLGAGPTWSAARRRLPVYVAAVALGAGLSAIQLLPTAELSSLSGRSGGLSYREAVSFSLRPHLLLYTLLPSFGEDLSQVFGSDGFAEFVGYVGVIPLLLALIGVCERWGRRETRFFLLLGMVGGGLALGAYNPLYFVLYKLLPGFGLFRVPARWMLLYSFALAMLSGVGADFLLSGGPWPGLRSLAERLRRLRLLWLTLAALLLAVPVGLLLVFLDFPAPHTLLVWLLLCAAMAGLIVARRRWPGARWQAVALVALVGAELFAAARSLPYDNPTAPEAFSSLRPSVAHLKAAGSGEQLQRVISLSGITFDPGDLKEIEQIFAGQLPPRAIYNYVVAAKEKEVLYYNFPLLYRLYSVDGYDGGVLPLRRFVTLQRLFLDEDDLSPDGRLRERLREVPGGRLLSLLNVRYVITDKVHDVWIDGIFYDLQFTALLGPPGVQEVGADEIPDFPATGLGVVSFLEGGAELPQGAQVAELTLTDSQGSVTSYTLRAGLDTAEGEYGKAGPVAHSQARVGHRWRDNSQGSDYISVIDWPQPRRLTSITIRYKAPVGRLHLRGLSLVDRRTGTSESLLLSMATKLPSTGGRFRLVHSGDVKIYENLDVLPRAYVVHRARVEPDDLAAVEAMRSPDFAPGEEVILAEGEPLAGRAGGADEVRVVGYEPERVEIAVKTASEGYLLLGDTYYPGWEVTVDGLPAALLRADLTFRAVHLSPGEHTVLFRYAPNSLRIGAIISLITALLVVTGGLFLAKRNVAQ